ncbi:MAG: GGDEF domain-containing protein [Rhodospirillales bacterium]|nr:GGDEF domain-containing protein [Rhodospirillales bacterium]
MALFDHLTVSLNLSADQAMHLLHQGPHSAYLRRHRSRQIYSRVQLMAAIFAVLTPLWAIIDYFLFDYPVWLYLSIIRMASAMVFLLLALPWKTEKTSMEAYGFLVILTSTPAVFYLFALDMFGDWESFSEASKIAANLYSLLPFIILAGLSIFPLTLLEVLLLGIPSIAFLAYGELSTTDYNLWSYVGTIWLAFLILGASTLASINQLRYMMTLVSRASMDPLTGVFTRRSGTEIIDVQFRVAARQGSHFTVGFIDLDNFKSINDTYGHDVGDKTLIMLVENLQRHLRRADNIVRWGGEEFIFVLPNTDTEGARIVIQRFIDEWFGERPDGKPLTASIGLAERISDKMDDWPHLVELADARMYKAKEGGRARAVICGDEVMAGDINKAKIPSDSGLPN